MPSRHARSAAALAALVAFTLPLAVPPAAAHCPAGTGGGISVPLVGIVSTCPHNASVEVVLDQWNQAAQGTMVWVLIKDFRFHPEIITVKSGGTVVWVYADTDQSQNHDPRSSGPCANAAVDPEAAPLACVPTSVGKCFDVFHPPPGGNGALMTAVGQTFPVTFKYLPSTGIVQKSRGFMSGTIVGDLTGAEPFKNCPPGTSVNKPGKAVVPYHCGLHGDAFTSRVDMRATLVILA